MTKSTVGICGALSLSLLAFTAQAERLPFQADVDICAKRAAELGDRSMSGSVRLQIMIREDGKVYAAYTHSAKGIEDKAFEYCLASNALLWFYPPVGLDTSAPFPISVVAGGTTTGQAQNSQSPPQVFLPSEHPEVEPSDLDVARAQATLNVLEDCSRAERGLAALAVHQYADALGELRAALEKDPNDRIALRGLAQTLAENHGDLVEARATAQKLLAIAPDSVVGYEALLRVCSAAKDDECVVHAWQKARAMRDAGPRKRILEEELLPLAKKAGIRLTALSEEKRTQTAAEAKEGPPPVLEDSCASEPDPNKQALCVVKRCLDTGSALYAQELSKSGKEFEVSDWRFKEASKDHLLVTRPIASRAKDGVPAEHRDALFLVVIGEHFSIKPASNSAKEIARAHNSCAKPAVPAPAPTPTPK